MSVSEFPTPAIDLDDEKKHRRDIAESIGLLFKGKSNNVLEVTLVSNATQTNVIDDRIGVHTVALCVPASVNAAAISTPYRSDMMNGSMVLEHASNIHTDKTFKVVLIG